MNAMQKCDEVLKYFLQSHERLIPPGIIEEHFVYSDINKNSDFSSIIMQHILNHLLHEGYIYKDELKINYKQHGKDIQEDFSYCLSIAGEIFISEDGYNGHLQKENIEKNRIRKQDDQILLLTIFLAIGSIGVLIIEALKFLLDYFL